MGEFDKARLALEASTGGRNTLMLDDLGMPSVMVRIPRFRWSDVITGGSDAVCSAFIVNGKELDEIFISKYPNIVRNNRGYSLAGWDPAVYVNYDQARTYCENKGKGWHLMTNAEWMAVAHWCKANGTIPRGNNLAGCDHTNRWEVGTESYEWARVEGEWNNRSKRSDGTYWYFTGRTLTGSGPTAWNHDWSPAGITDLNGNVWEWVAGLRLKDGELQIIPDNNAAANVDHSATSSLWRAINTGGSIVAPGSSNTYKYDYNGTAQNSTQASNGIAGGVILSTERTKPMYTGGDTDEDYAYSNMQFQALTNQSNAAPVMLLKELGLFPVDSDLQGDYLSVRNYGERLPLRGGTWLDAAGSGVFALHLSDARVISNHHVGFRAAFVDL